MIAVDIHDAGTKIKDLYQNNRWRLESLYTIVLEHIKDQINSMQFSLHEQVSDGYIWDNTDGIYSARSGYSWLLHQNGNFTSRWNWIWKLKAPENIKTHIWLEAHHSNPTLQVLQAAA